MTASTSFSLVYVDDRLLVVDKSSGLLAVPGLGPANQDNLVSRLTHAYETVLIVHRLDRDTSGVICLARDADAQRELSRQFRERLVAKHYHALVMGSVLCEEGRIDLPLAKDFDRPPRHRVDFVHGRPATTDWRVVERWVDRTFLELRPTTGRSHQLRVHLAAIGHAILGDPLYAPPETATLADRLMLHATELVIDHPTTRKRLSFYAPCPFIPSATSG